MQEREEDATKRPNRWRKWLVLFGITWVIIIGFCVGYPLVIAPWMAQRDANHNLEIWNSRDISSYSLTIEVRNNFRESSLSTYVLEVDRGVIASVEGFDLPSEDLQERFGGYTISGLFDFARDCDVLFCEIRYNEIYGFPEYILRGGLASDSIEVIEFTPLENG